MLFNITKLEIENFRSIQEKVTLNIKSGLFSIEGINYTETNSTNGSGKGQPEWLEIPTPKGFKQFKDLKIGDSVFGRNGLPTKITGVFPQGKKKIYKVKFSSGQETICDDAHLWTFYRGRFTKKAKTFSTKELLNLPLIEYKNNKYKAPNFYCLEKEIIEYKEKKFDIDPYIMGVVLGDGCIKHGYVNISNPDQDIYIQHKIENLIDKSIYYIKRDYSTICPRFMINLLDSSIKGNSYIQKFKNIGLFGKGSIDKFIPKEYFLGSINQRLELLRGLLDTDGHCQKRKGPGSSVQYSTSSLQLANDVKQLVFSLNGWCHIHTDNRKCNTNYVLQIQLPINPFSLPRKAESWKYTRRRDYLESIEEIGEANTICIKVDAEDELYITSDYILTHNTTLISALFWAFTGSSLTNEVLADEVVNLQVGKNCKVSVYISTEKDEIKITRTRKDSEVGNNLFLEINGQDLSCHKVADTQDRINKLIKIPFDLLKNTIIMTSNMNSAFSTLSPQQRINTLESIRDYSIWEKIRDEANKDSKLYTNEISNNNLEISNLKGKISTYEDLIKKTEQEKQEIESNSNVDKIDEDIQKLKEGKESQEIKIKEKEEEITTFKSTSKQVDTSVTMQKMNDIVAEVNELKAQVSKEKQDIDNKIRDIEYNKKDALRELDLIERWFKNDKCPTCGKKLDRTPEELTEKYGQLKQYKDQIETFNTAIASYIEERENSQLEVKINTQIDIKREEYASLQADLDTAKTMQELKDKELDKLQNELKILQTSYSTFDIKLTELKNRKENYITNLNKYKENIISYKNSVDENNSKIKELDEKNNELSNKKYLSDFYYKLLGAKGELRPYLLSKDIAYLNNRMQFYINRFFKNTEVNLVLNGNAIDIKIQADGVVKSISSLSGGEKKRVDISIQLALYDLIQTVSQSRFNLLCLDEIESLLDPIGCEQLIEIIEDKAENIETVWWITNHPSVKETITKKIIAKKILGKTEIEEL